MDDTGEWDDRAGGKDCLFKVHDVPLDDRPHALFEGFDLPDGSVLVVCRLVEGWDVNSFELTQSLQQGVAIGPRGLPALVDRENLQDDILTVAHHDGVDEVGDRLGVRGTRSPGDYQGVLGPPLDAQQGDTAQLKGVQDVGVGELVLEREADDIKGAKRLLALQAGQGELTAAQERLVVSVWAEDPLAGDPGLAVEDFV